MTKLKLVELWNTSDNVFEMLSVLHQLDGNGFQALVPQIHSYLLACCWKIQHLLPQPDIRKGLEVAARFIDGKASLQELRDIDWYMEAAAFALDYAKTTEEIAELKSMIGSIHELDGLSYKDARKLLLDAAYFADSSVIYPAIRPRPFNSRLFKSKFMCAELLREHVILDHRSSTDA